MADPTPQSPNRNYPLPHPDNVSARLDVQRIRDALLAVDGDIAGVLADLMTHASTDAMIAAAIAVLVDTAPATLDTLNELSVALANDPNFAATMTTALAGKADTGHGHADATNAAAGFMTAAQVTDLASVMAVFASLAKIDVKQAWAAVQRMDAEPIPFASTITPDFAVGKKPLKEFAPLTAAMTLELPVNCDKYDQVIYRVPQDATGGRVITPNAGYLNPPSWSTGANEVDVVSVFVLEVSGGNATKATMNALHQGAI